jgi:RND family efflux transporter MFP subunit
MYCIKSPIAGSVSRVDAKAGESVLPGNDIISVVDQKETWVELQIDEIDIAEVSVGQQVRIYTDAYADQVFLGKVAWKSPEAELKKVAGNIKMDEEDLVFRAKVVLLSGKKILKPGMSVTGEIVTHKKAGVLVIPREAIFVSDNKSYVFVAVKGKARKKEITLGSRDPDNVEVIRGISSGETIAISNLAKLKDKGAVKIER